MGRFTGLGWKSQDEIGFESCHLISKVFTRRFGPVEDVESAIAVSVPVDPPSAPAETDAAATDMFQDASSGREKSWLEETMDTCTRTRGLDCR